MPFPVSSSLPKFHCPGGEGFARLAVGSDKVKYKREGKGKNETIVEIPDDLGAVVNRARDRIT